MIQKPDTAAQFQVDILQALANTGIRQLSPGAKARAYGDIVADKLAEVENREFANLGETLLYYATGASLDFIGELYGVYRLGETSASAAAFENNFRFYVRSGTFGGINNQKDIVIPAGVKITTATPGGPIYTTDPITLKAGDSSTYITATCTTPGSTGNGAAQVFTAHNFTGYADSVYGSLLVTNDYGLVGGSDAEEDDNYRYRIQLKIQSQSGANEAAVRLQLLQVPGIQDIVFARQAGTFDCYVYGIAPQTSPALLDAVQQVVNQIVAFPLTGNAVSPDLVGISLATSLRLSGSFSSVDQDTVIAAGVAAAQNYINNLTVGQTLVINEIANRIRNADRRILDVGQPNNQIPEIFIWRARPDATRYSRFLLGNYTPQIGERIVVEVHDGLTNPITLTVATT